LEDHNSLTRTRTYGKQHAGLIDSGDASQLASQSSVASGHGVSSVGTNDDLKEVVANWPSIPESVRQAIVAIIRSISPKRTP
jgi:hypothetical protein